MKLPAVRLRRTGYSEAKANKLIAVIKYLIRAHPKIKNTSDGNQLERLSYHKYLEDSEQLFSQTKLYLQTDTGTCAIAGARNADQAGENAGAGAISLSDDELSEIDEIERGVTDYLDEDPVMWNF